MQRRQFLQRTATGVAMAAAPGIPLAEAAGQGTAEVQNEVDVMVVGGGTAGTVAAIQAARAGAKTLLLEREGMLGGTMTVGGVSFPGLFHAWGRQIIAGIGWELVTETVALDGGELPDFSVRPDRHWKHQIQTNPHLYALLAEEKCRRAGAEIAYYEFPLSASRTDGGWLVECVGPGTRRRVACRQLVDCTGGADVVGLLGFPRLREDEIQPGSMLFRFDSPFRPGREQPQAVYVHGADSSSSATRTRANLAGRGEILKRIRQKQESGQTPPRLVHLQPEAAFRESCRIVAETPVTHEDYVAGRRFEDAVCNAFYPVDLHTRQGVRPKPLAEGVVPTVPLRALVPKGSRDLLVAGRSVGSDRLANSGLRVQAPCMAMGQAAGAAAALAARRECAPLEVPLAELRALLRAHGAVVPG